MFLAGLEIDMFHLKKNLTKGMTFGLYTFLVPMILGTVSAVFLLHFDLMTSVLLASMYASHTLLAYPVVSRFGLTRSPAVIITVAGTIVTVLGALLVLAGVVSIHTEGAFNWSFLWRLAGSMSLYWVGVVYVYPRLTRWFFKKYNDSVAQFIYILALVLLASWVAQMIGLESVLGAFFAGLVLNRYIPNLSPLMNRIEFVGNAIFIPYFLIGVGMLINIKVVASSWQTLYVAAVMSAVATLCKWIAAWLTQKTFKMTAVDRSMMFGLSNAQAAATLAAVMIGYQIGLLDESVLNGTIVMILITCAISSVVTERAAMKMKTARMADDEPQVKVRNTATLIPVANPLTVAGLVDLAVMMRNPGSRRPIYALHVRNDNSESSRAIGRNSLDVAVEAAASVDHRLTPIERYDISTVAGLINTIEERDISEVIMGLHRKSTIIDSFLGSKIEQLLRLTNRMLVLARCYIPVNTVTRIVVSVPPKAQYETGFRRWVTAVANLTRQVSCRVIFCCRDDVQAAIRSVLFKGRYEVRSEYRTVNDWDDFVVLANRVLDDDLFIVVSSRVTSVSYSSDMAELPSFLQRYFSRNNLMVIYPDQFGPEGPAMTFVDPLANDLTSQPSALWVKLRGWWRSLIALRKRFTQRGRQRRIDL
jgi:Kef-type K+ transport system membrane component KefB/phage gp36-like protein